MEQKKDNKGPLTATDIKRFKTLLLGKLDEILDNVICMEEGTLRQSRTDLSNMPFHMADAGTDTYEIENTLGLMDSERKLIVEIQDALERIENGTYGICEGNNEPIPRERLKAIPWTRYCVNCASLAEKGILNQKSYDLPAYNDWGIEDYDDFEEKRN